MGELAGREFGEVFITWADDPPNGPRMRIAAAGPRVLITAALLAMVEAGESPWASLAGCGKPGEGDPCGYAGALLRIDADGLAVDYRVGGYMPSARCYVAELKDEPGRRAARR